MLLAKIDDQRSGLGYFLALHLGNWVEPAPPGSDANPFTPDQTRDEYRAPHGRADKFFPDTVERARQWWRKRQE